MRSFARRAFGFVVHLHPNEFRIEFGDEMLWIFDEQMNGSARGIDRVVLYARLLLDVLRSAFIQHTLRERLRPDAVGPHFGQIGSSARVIQVAQGGFIVFSCLFNIFIIALCLHMVMSSL
jgi:hypothetical protein